ncbi:MAG: GIY-YIG nuclease family protein [Candidatus Omnitrophica bacterium]|nr:GIY-YIG nuclease family protein [Candidatus Omnitrophota bacterium]
MCFKKGVYFYIGSAKKNLAARVARHCSLKKKVFWHIDYLLASRRAAVKMVLVRDKDEECQTARFLYRNGGGFVHQFGSSDCRCPSHLFFLKDVRGKKFARLLAQRGFRYADKGTVQ